MAGIKEYYAGLMHAHEEVRGEVPTPLGHVAFNKFADTPGQGTQKGFTRCESVSCRVRCVQRCESHSIFVLEVEGIRHGER